MTVNVEKDVCVSFELENTGMGPSSENALRQMLEQKTRYPCGQITSRYLIIRHPSHLFPHTRTVLHLMHSTEILQDPSKTPPNYLPFALLTAKVDMATARSSGHLI
jgi:hypothetical protein